MCKKSIFKQTIAALLFLLSTQSNAEFVAGHLDVISKNTAILYQLSDLSGKRCSNGTRLAIVSITDSYSYPRFTPYAYGCWAVSEGRISIVGKSHDGQTNIDISYDASVFKGENADWTRFVVEKEAPAHTLEFVEQLIKNVEDNIVSCLGVNRAKVGEQACTCDSMDEDVMILKREGYCMAKDNSARAGIKWVKCH